jgi:hypothetical protein
VKVVKASRNSQDDLKSTGQWLFWLQTTDKNLNFITVATSTKRWLEDQPQADRSFISRRRTEFETQKAS